MNYAPPPPLIPNYPILVKKRLVLSKSGLSKRFTLYIFKHSWNRYTLIVLEFSLNFCEFSGENYLKTKSSYWKNSTLYLICVESAEMD